MEKATLLKALQALQGIALMAGGRSGMVHTPITSLRALGLNNDPRNIQIDPRPFDALDLAERQEREAINRFAELTGRSEYGRLNSTRDINRRHKQPDDWFDIKARENPDKILTKLARSNPEFFQGGLAKPSTKITTDAIKRSYGEPVKEAVTHPEGELVNFFYENPDIHNLFTDIVTKSQQVTELNKFEKKNLKKRAFMDEYGESSARELKQKEDLSIDELLRHIENTMEKKSDLGETLARKNAIRKEARQLSQGYRRGEVDLQAPKPIQKINKQYITQSSRNAPEIYRDLANITNKDVNKYIDVKKMKHAIRELRSLKGQHVSITPNKEAILSELQSYNPELAEQVRNAVGNREYIFPTDLDAFQLTADDYRALPRTSNELRYMGHQTHYTPARQLRDQIKGTSVGRWLDWVSPDSTHTTAPNKFDSFIEGAFTPFEKYLAKPNIVHNDVNNGLINAHYDAIESLLREHAKGTAFTDQIEEALSGPDRQKHLEAYLNNPEAYIGDPSEGLALKENFQFRRPVFEDIFPMLSTQEATEVGDAVMSLGKKMGASNPRELLSMVREDPNLFLKELRAIAPNNPLARKSPYFITQYMNKPTNFSGLNLDALGAVHFDKPAASHLRDAFDYSGNLPEHLPYGALNDSMESGGLRSVGDIVDDLRSVDGSFHDAQSSPSEYGDARSYQSNEFDDARRGGGEIVPHEMNAPLERVLGPTQKRMFPKSFDRYAGKALKGLGRLSDIGIIIDGAYTGSQSAVGYKDLIQEKGLLQGGYEGFKDQMGRAFNYVNKMYEDAKSGSVFSSLNKYLPTLDYYSSDRVNQGAEDAKSTGNIITDTGNKISETGANLSNVLGVSNDKAELHDELYGDNVIGIGDYEPQPQPQSGGGDSSPLDTMSMGFAPRPHKQDEQHTTANPVIAKPTAQQDLIMNTNPKAQL